MVPTALPSDPTLRIDTTATRELDARPFAVEWVPASEPTVQVTMPWMDEVSNGVPAEIETEISEVGDTTIDDPRVPTGAPGEAALAARMAPCSCLGACRGKDGLGPGWRCALEDDDSYWSRQRAPRAYDGCASSGALTLAPSDSGNGLMATRLVPLLSLEDRCQLFRALERIARACGVPVSCAGMPWHHVENVHLRTEDYARFTDWFVGLAKTKFAPLATTLAKMAPRTRDAAIYSMYRLAEALPAIKPIKNTLYLKFV